MASFSSLDRGLDFDTKLCELSRPSPCMLIGVSPNRQTANFPPPPIWTRVVGCLIADPGVDLRSEPCPFVAAESFS